MKISTLILITLLTGCTNLTSNIETAVTKTAEFNDKKIDIYIYGLCSPLVLQAPLLRRFDTEDKFYSKELFCGENFEGENKNENK